MTLRPETNRANIYTLDKKKTTARYFLAGHIHRLFDREFDEWHLKKLRYNVSVFLSILPTKKSSEISFFFNFDIFLF